MVNSVLSSLATFYISSIKVLIEIMNQIDKYRRHCLQRGGDVNAKNLHWQHGKWSLNQNQKDG
jgi:hypothetical protein